MLRWSGRCSCRIGGTKRGTWEVGGPKKIDSRGEGDLASVHHPAIANARVCVCVCTARAFIVQALALEGDLIDLDHASA